MRRLIVAGLVYLTGIAVLLLIKPKFMFREDGRWKEFGIGRDPENFTYCPFWLFTILWAMISYIVILFMEEPNVQTQTQALAQPLPLANVSRARNIGVANAVQELVPGYYMLNEGGTGRNGVPRYVYLGPEEP